MLELRAQKMQSLTHRVGRSYKCSREWSPSARQLVHALPGPTPISDHQLPDRPGDNLLDLGRLGAGITPGLAGQPQLTRSYEQGNGGGDLPAFFGPLLTWGWSSNGLSY